MTLQHIIRINDITVPILSQHGNCLVIERPGTKDKDRLFLRSGKVLYRDQSGKFKSEWVRDMNTYEPLEISCPSWTEDGKLFARIWNKGIDARLEAFVQSTAAKIDNRLVFLFHPDEVQILLRRLSEDEETSDDFTSEWISGIVFSQYGFEV